jgi:hypothetical protein
MSYYRNLILSGGYYWDSDAVAFLNAASITDAVVKKAVNNYVIGLKNKSLWTRIVALYPFVGGTATTHKYNLKDPQDTDAAFRMTFSGGVTHDSNGVTFDGINGFGNTHVIPSTSLTLNDESMFLYSRTSAQGAAGNTDMGAAVGTNQREELFLRNSSGNFNGTMNSTTNTATTTNTDAKGLYVLSRTSSTNLQGYKNGSSIVTQTNANAGTRSNIKLYVGARNVSNSGNGFINRNYALAGCGLGFDATQSSEFYTLTQTFQTSLSRQV